MLYLYEENRDNFMLSWNYDATDIKEVDMKSWTEEKKRPKTYIKEASD